MTDNKQLEDLVEYLEKHTGLTRYLSLYLQPNTLKVESIRAAQVGNNNAIPNTDVYVGFPRPDLVLKWFRKYVEPSLRRSIQHAEIRALCLFSHIIPTEERVRFTREIAGAYGDDWHKKVKATTEMYNIVQFYCHTVGTCPFCGCHETFDGKLRHLVCGMCGHYWSAEDPIRAGWKQSKVMV